ncbi:hypothetical protein ACQCN2_21700 [Brevibacillus ginsengisoli]|uniref:hypothetical protein n=1 Tax=Brevibacillus ginsengisoli TaxID=363854 RepID=UPI003CEFF10F
MMEVLNCKLEGVKMKKTVVVLCAAFLMSILSGCTDPKPTETTEKKQVAQSTDYQAVSSTYKNEKLGFSISFPEAWKDKFICKDTEWGVDVQYKAANSENVTLFTIEMDTEIQFAIDEAYVGLKKKLGERGPVVVTVFSPTGAAYDEKNEKEKKDYEEYSKLFNEKDSVLKSFQLLPGYDKESYEKFQKLNKEKDESLRDDYEKLGKKNSQN